MLHRSQNERNVAIATDLRLGDLDRSLLNDSVYRAPLLTGAFRHGGIIGYIPLRCLSGRCPGSTWPTYSRHAN